VNQIYSFLYLEQPIDIPSAPGYTPGYESFPGIHHSHSASADLRRIDMQSVEQRHMTGDRVLFTLFFSYYSLKQRQNAEAVLDELKTRYPDSNFLRSMESMIMWAGD